MEKRVLIRLGSGNPLKDFRKMPKAEDCEGLILRAILEERAGGEMKFWDASAVIPLFLKESDNFLLDSP